jgi:recombination protein RecA
VQAIMATFNEQKNKKVNKSMAKKKTMNKGTENKSASSALENINKKYGKGTASFLGSEDLNIDIGRIPFGIIELDTALGGGAPRGRVIELYGSESGGKTSLLLQLVAQVQKQGGTAAYLDAEHAMSIEQAKSLGVDIDSLIFIQPDYMEQTFDIAKELISSGDVDLVIVDSTNSLVPRSELEGDFGQAQMGLAARELSQALKMLTGLVSKTNTTLAFVSQIRASIGPFAGQAVGIGNAMKFYASVRMDIKRIESLKKGEDVYGIKSRVKVVKNKTAPPFRQAEITLLFNRGYDVQASLLNVATKKDVIQKSGSWYSYNDAKIGQGEANVCEYLRENPEIYEEIYDKVMSKISNDSEDSPEIPPNIDPETGEILEDSPDQEITEDPN